MTDGTDQKHTDDEMIRLPEFLRAGDAYLYFATIVGPCRIDSGLVQQCHQLCIVPAYQLATDPFAAWINLPPTSVPSVCPCCALMLLHGICCYISCPKPKRFSGACPFNDMTANSVGQPTVRWPGMLSLYNARFLAGKETLGTCGKQEGHKETRSGPCSELARLKTLLSVFLDVHIE